jgi:hypothetical protein
MTLRTLRQSIAYTPAQNMKAQAGITQPLPVIDPRNWQGQSVPERQWFVEGWIPIDGDKPQRCGRLR